eukprot:Stramenopile-MAST_4_protein_1028
MNVSGLKAIVIGDNTKPEELVRARYEKKFVGFPGTWTAEIKGYSAANRTYACEYVDGFMESHTLEDLKEYAVYQVDDTVERTAHQRWEDLKEKGIQFCEFPPIPDVASKYDVVLDFDAASAAWQEDQPSSSDDEKSSSSDSEINVSVASSSTLLPSKRKKTGHSAKRKTRGVSENDERVSGSGRRTRRAAQLTSTEIVRHIIAYGHEKIEFSISSFLSYFSKGALSSLKEKDAMICCQVLRACDFCAYTTDSHKFRWLLPIEGNKSFLDLHQLRRSGEKRRLNIRSNEVMNYFSEETLTKCTQAYMNAMFCNPDINQKGFWTKAKFQMFKHTDLYYRIGKYMIYMLYKTDEPLLFKHLTNWVYSEFKSDTSFGHGMEENLKRAVEVLAAAGIIKVTTSTNRSGKTIPEVLSRKLTKVVIVHPPKPTVVQNSLLSKDTKTVPPLPHHSNSKARKLIAKHELLVGKPEVDFSGSDSASSPGKEDEDETGKEWHCPYCCTINHYDDAISLWNHIKEEHRSTTPPAVERATTDHPPEHDDLRREMIRLAGLETLAPTPAGQNLSLSDKNDRKKANEKAGSRTLRHTQTNLEYRKPVTGDRVTVQYEMEDGEKTFVESFPGTIKEAKGGKEERFVVKFDDGTCQNIPLQRNQYLQLWRFAQPNKVRAASANISAEQTGLRRLSRDELIMAVGPGSSDYSNQSKLFLKRLKQFHESAGSKVVMRKLPILGEKKIDLYRLFIFVYAFGGFDKVESVPSSDSNHNSFAAISKMLPNFSFDEADFSFRLKNIYKTYLYGFEKCFRSRYADILPDVTLENSGEEEASDSDLNSTSGGEESDENTTSGSGSSSGSSSEGESDEISEDEGKASFVVKRFSSYHNDLRRIMEEYGQFGILPGKSVLVCPEKTVYNKRVEYFATLNPDASIIDEADNKRFTSLTSWALHCVRKRYPNRSAVNGWQTVFYQPANADPSSRILMATFKRQADLVQPRPASFTSETSASGREAKRKHVLQKYDVVRAKWGENSEFYPGRVREIDSAGKVAKIIFDDGDKAIVDLRDIVYMYTPTPGTGVFDEMYDEDEDAYEDFRKKKRLVRPAKMKSAFRFFIDEEGDSYKKRHGVKGFGLVKVMREAFNRLSEEEKSAYEVAALESKQSWGDEMMEYYAAGGYVDGVDICLPGKRPRQKRAPAPVEFFSAYFEATQAKLNPTLERNVVLARAKQHWAKMSAELKSIYKKRHEDEQARIDAAWSRWFLKHPEDQIADVLNGCIDTLEKEEQIRSSPARQNNRKRKRLARDPIPDLIDLHRQGKNHLPCDADSTLFATIEVPDVARLPAVTYKHPRGIFVDEEIEKYQKMYPKKTMRDVQRMMRHCFDTELTERKKGEYRKKHLQQKLSWGEKALYTWASRYRSGIGILDQVLSLPNKRPTCRSPMPPYEYFRAWKRAVDACDYFYVDPKRRFKVESIYRGIWKGYSDKQKLPFREWWKHDKRVLEEAWSKWYLAHPEEEVALVLEHCVRTIEHLPQGVQIATK